jgi:hypothetical protein
VDTPGTGSVHGHNTAEADAVLPSMDAAIFVLSSDPPVSAIEREGAAAPSPITCKDGVPAATIRAGDEASLTAGISLMASARAAIRRRCASAPGRASFDVARLNHTGCQARTASSCL